MYRTFDLFERFPDGSSLWRACVQGLEGTRHHLTELSKSSENRFYAMDIRNGRIVSHNLEHVGANLTVARKMSKRSKSAVA